MNEKKDSNKPTKSEQPNSVDEIVDNIKQLPEEQQQQTMTKLEMYSGPIPDSKTLGEYDKLYPGAAKLIIENGVEESKHRRALETEMVHAAKSDRHRRDWMGFVLGVLGICVGAFLIYMDHYIVGSLFSGVSLIGLVGLFLGNNDDSKDD